MFLERSSFFGLCLAVGSPGEPGSFFTMIFGLSPARDALGGDDFCEFTAAPAALGLPLPDRGCAADPLLDAAFAGGGGGGAATVLCAVGDVVLGGWRSEPYDDGLSCGPGDGATATAVLIFVGL